MTTLELAEQIARAVLHEVDSGEMALLPHDDYFKDDPSFSRQSRHDLANTVLTVLRDNGAWFCRVTMEELPDGTHGETQQSLFEDV